MKEFKKWMIALDNSETDDSILKLLSLLFRYHQPDKVYFVHVVPSLDEYYIDFIQEHRADFLEKRKSLDEVLTEEFQKKINQYFADLTDKLDIVIEVLEGNPLQQLLHRAEIKYIDLLVVGHKESSWGSGITSKALCRNYKGSMLFVPKKEKWNIQNLIVPTDFSDDSALALQQANDFSEFKMGCAVKCLHIFDVSYFLNLDALIDEAQYEFDLRNKLTDNWKKFTQKHQIDTEEIKFTLYKKDRRHISYSIAEFAEQFDYPLLILGAKGHTQLQLALLGSTTERILQYEKKLPILVIK